MFGSWLDHRNQLPDIQGFHFERPALSGALAAAFERGQHLLVHGAPRQGKSTLVRRLLKDLPSVTFHATDESQFSDIFRTYLLTLGASVTVEQKRRRKLGAKAEVAWKWPLFSAGGSVDGEAESEVTRRNFSADLTNPNDICYLLREFKDAPCLVVEHFEQMGRKQRRLLLGFLRIAAEAGALRIILVASTLEPPLDSRERIEVGRALTLLEVPPLTPSESEACVSACLSHLGCTPSRATADFLYQTFEGGVGATVGTCALASFRLHHPEEGPSLHEQLLREIQEQTQTQFLALLAAIVEAGWTVTTTRKVAHAASEEAWEPSGTLPIADALARDPVFRNLHEATLASQEAPPATGDGLDGLRMEAQSLGTRILATPTEAETVRLLAFALGLFLGNPQAPVQEAYAPALSELSEETPIGFVFCDLLAAADLDREVVLTAEALAAYFRGGGQEIVEPRYGNPVFTRMARRVRRLQRRLGITPPVFRVNDEATRITLWDPRYGGKLGDPKPRLRELMENLQDDDPS